MVSFTFGIPLLPRKCARNWPMIEHLLGLTLTSVLAQTDQDFRVVIAGHDRPQNLPEDWRIHFLQADWLAEVIHPDNRDRGRKTHAINAHVLDSGGGLLMFVDADDWVDRRLVGAARTIMGPDFAAGIIESGFAVDFQNLRAAPLPHPRVFNRAFHRICGSSAVFKLCPDHSDPLYRDPYARLHEHHRLVEAAEEAGLGLARLPLAGCYIVNTSESHSEIHGPYASWRISFNQAVRRVGRPMDQDFATRFGLDLFDLSETELETTDRRISV